MKNLLLISILVLTACATTVQRPTVKLKDVRFADLDSKGASLNFLLTVNNPNTFDLPLQGYTYAVQVMDAPLAIGESKDGMNFPAGNGTDMLIPVRVSFNDVLEIIKRSPGLRDIPYRLKANLIMGTPIGSITVPVSKNGAVAIPKQYQPANLLQKFGDFLNKGNR